jgi:hypothetical protein
MKIQVYGSSDDLIELEQLGEDGTRFADGWDAEFELHWNYVSYLAFSTGTLLRVSYDGQWHIVPLERGSCKIDYRPATDLEVDYSDVVTLECVDGFSWVVCSGHLERLSGTLDNFVS